MPGDVNYCQHDYHHSSRDTCRHAAAHRHFNSGARHLWPNDRIKHSFGTEDGSTKHKNPACIHRVWQPATAWIGTRACPVDHGTESRSQMRIEATSIVGEDVDAFVVASGYSAELFERVDGAFDGVALGASRWRRSRK
jgi:hypothetical protein